MLSFSVFILNSGQYLYNYDASHVPAGTYFITLIFKNQTITTKFIKVE
ncbi:MAG: T9SS type A sorting domain-containing protein [Mariniphaga sp.]|nr:T9SS type A sorting domain-containing protein [Mariniphaga sp.]